MSIPVKDSVLVGYIQGFTGKIVATPAAYGVAVPASVALDAATDAFLAAYNTMIEGRANGSRSVLQTAETAAKKAELLAIARELYGQIQDSRSVSDALKLDLGIVVKGQEPTPEPVPLVAPGIATGVVTGRSVELRFFDPANEEGRRALPPGTSGLTLFSAVGESAPAGREGWFFEGSTGKNKAIVIFPQSVAPGAKVWFTAFYFNNRKQSGPLTTPAAFTFLQGGSNVVSG